MSIGKYPVAELLFSLVCCLVENSYPALGSIPDSAQKLNNRSSNKHKTLATVFASCGRACPGQMCASPASKPRATGDVRSFLHNFLGNSERNKNAERDQEGKDDNGSPDGQSDQSEGSEESAKPRKNGRPASGNVDRPEWHSATRAWTSTEGAAGVIFVEVASGVLVLKGTSRIAEEVYSSVLARLVDVNTPKMRIIQWTSSEYKQIKTKIAQLTMGKTDEVNVKVRYKLESELDRPFFIVMELVAPSRLLDGFPPADFEQLIRSSPIALRDIGNIIAFDAFINNVDRIPAVHNNEGNAKNVLVCEARRIRPIDTNITCIDPGNEIARRNYQRYVNKISSFFEIMCSGQCEMMVHRLEETRDFIIRETAYDVGPSGCLLIAEGVRETLGKLQQLQLQDAVDALNMMIGIVTEDWSDIWKNAVQMIKVEFLRGMFEVVHSMRVMPLTQHKTMTLPAELSASPGVSVTVMLAQHPCDGIDELVNFLQGQIVAQEHPHIDVVVLPEEAIPDPEHADLSALQVFATTHQLCILSATTVDARPSSESDLSCVTSIFIDQDGALFTTFRERNCMGDGENNSYPTAFTTRWGKLVVLDSYDMEDDKCVQRALELQPQLIVNPCQILAVNGQSSAGLWSTWRFSLESTNHRLEYIAHTHNVTIVRCDMAYPRGMANSSVITPAKTVIMHTMEPAAMVVNIGIPDMPLAGDLSQGRHRTARMDNTGIRYIVTSHPMPAVAVVAVASCKLPNTLKGQLIVARSDHMLDVLDVASGDIIASTAFPSEVQIAQLDCDRDGRELRVYDEHGIQYRWALQWGSGGGVSITTVDEVSEQHYIPPTTVAEHVLLDRLGGRYRLVCTPRQVHVQKVDMAEVLYSFESFASRPYSFAHYSAVGGWLALVNDRHLRILQFQINCEPIAFASLFPV